MSEKVELNRECVRILRTEGEIVLKNMEKDSGGGVDLNRQSDLRQAVREASKRLEEADAVRAERNKE